MPIIYHESFPSVSEKGPFEYPLSLEIQFCMTPEGKILDCNRNGEMMVNRFGRSFLDFFRNHARYEAEEFLQTVRESREVVTVLLHHSTTSSGVGTLYNGLYKDSKIYLAGFQTDLMTKFAAEFVHELRNPLTVIRGFVQLSAYSQDIDKYQKTILAEIDRMHNLLENFLRLSKRKIHFEPIAPDKLCSSLIALISSECKVKKVRLDYEVDDSDQVCSVDFSMIKQVMLNIFRNALEAVEAKGVCDKRLFFKGSAEKEGYRFALTDNGAGIETDALKKIGRSFYSTKQNGTGIGLSLCKKIIADHHGSFCISSVHGKGTTVSFLLPFAVKEVLPENA
ncbi:MAG: HAMP domain-containing histidine kinase [Sporolactobacillus sp.]|nr:HAMP domain-containing histidine kinase [Sporolactobacillus sp.]